MTATPVKFFVCPQNQSSEIGWFTHCCPTVSIVRASKCVSRFIRIVDEAFGIGRQITFALVDASMKPLPWLKFVVRRIPMNHLYPIAGAAPQNYPNWQGAGEQYE